MQATHTALMTRRLKAADPTMAEGPKSPEGGRRRLDGHGFDGGGRHDCLVLRMWMPLGSVRRSLKAPHGLHPHPVLSLPPQLQPPHAAMPQMCQRAKSQPKANAPSKQSLIPQ